MTDAIRKGMIAQLEKEGYDKELAEEIADEVYEDVDAALFDAHGEYEDELANEWVAYLVGEHVGGDYELFGALIIQAHMYGPEAMVEHGVPHQFYDHIAEMV